MCEDARCANPCGMEPLGCNDCGVDWDDEDKLDYEDPIGDLFDDGRYDDDPNPYFGTYSEE